MLNFLKIFVLMILSVSCVDGATETSDLLTGGACGRTSRVAGGVVHSHQPFNTLPPIANDFNCFFQMRAVRFNQKVRFMFTHFSLSPNDCSMTNLTFYDGSMETDPEIALICPDTTDVLTREYVSTGFFLTFKLSVSSSSTEQRSANFSGFYVSYTDDRDPCVNSTAELMCNNGRCIFNELECDGMNSCGDGTDEMTTAPTFCDGNTTPAASPTNTSPSDLFSDLTPLYITLTIAFAMLLAYVVYILLSFGWFKAWIVSCLHHCFLVGIRRRRKWKEKNEKPIQNTESKVSPQSPVEVEDLTAIVPPTPTSKIPPIFTLPSSNTNGTNLKNESKTDKKNEPTKEKAKKKTTPKQSWAKK